MKDVIHPFEKILFHLKEKTPPPGVYGEDNSMVSAGKFEKTPEGFRFAGSPEAQETIRRVKEQTGLDLEVVPFNDPDAWYDGYFRSDAAVGGSEDPERRRIYMNPKADALSQFVLEHEVGHAVDPYLLKSNRQSNEMFEPFLRKKEAGEYKTPAEALEAYMLVMPRKKLDTELTAQRYAADKMKERGLSDSYSKGDLADYPLAYIDQGQRTFDLLTAAHAHSGIVPDSVAETYGRKVLNPLTSTPYVGRRPAPYIEGYTPDQNLRVEYGDELARRLLGLYMTPGYAEQADKIKRRAENYAERRLQE